MIVRGNETLLVQGITGKQGTFWADKMREYGTKVIGGVNPKKAGTQHLDLPVWGSACDAVKGYAASMRRCCSSRRSGSRLRRLMPLRPVFGKLVIMTEHVPVQDVMYVMAAAREAGTKIIGPNTAGLVTPGECFVGFMPAFNPQIFQVGNIRRHFALRQSWDIGVPQSGAGRASAYRLLSGSVVIR